MLRDEYVFIFVDNAGTQDITSDTNVTHSWTVFEWGTRVDSGTHSNPASMSIGPATTGCAPAHSSTITTCSATAPTTDSMCWRCVYNGICETRLSTLAGTTAIGERQ